MAQLMGHAGPAVRARLPSNQLPKQPTSQVHPSSIKGPHPELNLRAPSRAPSSSSTSGQIGCGTSTHRHHHAWNQPIACKKAKTSLSSPRPRVSHRSEPTTRGSGSKEKLKLGKSSQEESRVEPDPQLEALLGSYAEQDEVPPTTITDTLPTHPLTPRTQSSRARGSNFPWKWRWQRSPAAAASHLVFFGCRSLRNSALPTGISVSHEDAEVNLESVGNHHVFSIELDSESSSPPQLQLAGLLAAASVPSPLQLLDAAQQRRSQYLVSPSYPSLPFSLTSSLRMNQEEMRDEDAFVLQGPSLKLDWMAMAHATMRCHWVTLGNGMGKPTGNPHGLWVQLLQSCVSGSQTLSEAMERVKPRVPSIPTVNGYRLDYGLTNTLGGNGTGKPPLQLLPCMRDEASGVIGYSGGVHAPVSCVLASFHIRGKAEEGYEQPELP
ncbi:hypothetical protein BU15DRAFT_68783 [Melanogaster broomeanus]|nr:hypothetical protein BU15DRAFT_68783 [Melanogaster broomeanus]